MKFTFRRVLIWLYLKIENGFIRGFRIFRAASRSLAGKEMEISEANCAVDAEADISERTAIIITTFEARFFLYALPLVDQIRKSTDTPIFILINGNYSEPARGRNLQLFFRNLSEYEDIYPISFSQMQGCASMWNTGLVHAAKEFNFVFNDDIVINPATFKTDMKIAISKAKITFFTAINHSFSHFLITQECISKVGFFDERFIGFGEEDVDYIHRYSEFFHEVPPSIDIRGIVNITDPSRDEAVPINYANYSVFNHLLKEKLYVEDMHGTKGWSEEILRRQIPLVDPKPMESFRHHFYPLIGSVSKSELADELERYFN